MARPGYNETACPSGGRVSDTERCFPDEFNPEELPYFHRTVVLKGSAAVLFSHACCSQLCIKLVFLQERHRESHSLSRNMGQDHVFVP